MHLMNEMILLLFESFHHNSFLCTYRICMCVCVHPTPLHECQCLNPRGLIGMHAYLMNYPPPSSTIIQPPVQFSWIPINHLVSIKYSFRIDIPCNDSTGLSMHNILFYSGFYITQPNPVNSIFGLSGKSQILLLRYQGTINLLFHMINR